MAGRWAGRRRCRRPLLPPAPTWDRFTRTSDFRSRPPPAPRQVSSSYFYCCCCSYSPAPVTTQARARPPVRSLGTRPARAEWPRPRHQSGQGGRGRRGAGWRSRRSGGQEARRPGGQEARREAGCRSRRPSKGEVTNCIVVFVAENPSCPNLCDSLSLEPRKYFVCSVE